MKRKIILFAALPFLAAAQHSVDMQAIENCTLPPLDTVLAHAMIYSPTLFGDQGRVDASETFYSKWGFLASLLPSPSYSFSGLDRGWKLSFSLSSITTSWKEYMRSRDRSADLERNLIHQKKLLRYRIHEAYTDIESALLALKRSEMELKRQRELFEIHGARHRQGKLSDIDFIQSRSVIERLEFDIQEKRFTARRRVMALYEVSGYILEKKTCSGRGSPEIVPQRGSMGLEN